MCDKDPILGSYHLRLGLKSNRVEMKRQYAKLLESCDTQA